MKNRLISQILLIIISLGLLLTACKEDEPKKEPFSWSPDGKKLAMVTSTSKEMLLLDIEKDRIGNIAVVDSFMDNKTMIYAPRWSADGKYFLYTKKENDHFYIIIYSVSDDIQARLVSYPVALPLHEKEPIHFPAWSPQNDRILFTEMKNNHVQIKTMAPDGRDKRILTELKGMVISPVWSPDGKWIAYAVDDDRDTKNNGIWKMKSDGSAKERIYASSKISLLKWAPDGSRFAFVKKIMTKNDTTDVLVSININGDKEITIFRTTPEITQFDWSPDGQQISFYHEKNSEKNIWLVDARSLNKVKLSFDNVGSYFGWGQPDQLFFTIQYPEELVVLPVEEKDRREFINVLYGVNNKNILMSMKNDRLNKLGNNIKSYKYCPQNNSAAFFKISSKGFLEPEIYLPVVKLADGEIVHIARTKDEHVIAADLQYLDGNFQKALSHLSAYWNADLRSADLRANFDVDSIISLMATNGDSSRFELLLEGFKEGTLIRTILTLRRLGEAEKASWMFEQFKKLTSLVLKKEGSGNDDMLWKKIQAYGKYRELEQGINDLEDLYTTVKGDSLFNSFLHFGQSFLALENERYDFGLKKLKTSADLMPASNDELEPFNFLLANYLEKIEYKYNPTMIAIFQQLMKRFPHSRDLYETYHLLGDYYQKMGKNNMARQAYQNAVVYHFNESKVWNKLFALELQ